MFKGSGDFSEDDTESKTRVNRGTKKPLPSKSYGFTKTKPA